MVGISPEKRGFYRLHDTLINFFYDYLPIHCAIALEQDPDYWHPLSIPQRGLLASHFEIRFGHRQARRDMNRRSQEQSRRRGRAVVGSHAGMHDLYLPIRRQGKHLAWVILGSFQERLPSRELCWRQWKALRRAPGTDDAADFLLYLRARLETPVLPKAFIEGVKPLLVQAGEALIGLRDPVETADALDRFKARVASHQLPWRMWHFAESKRDALNFDQGPYEPHEVMPWDAEEFGIRRAPDAVLAFCVPDLELDAAGAMAETARLQAAVFELCQGKEGLVAGRAATEAALVLSALERRHDAPELAQRVQDALRRTLGYRPVASWAAFPRKPERMPEAIASAEAGLRLAMARGTALVEAPASLDEGQAFASLEGLSQEWAKAWAQGKAEAARLTWQKIAEAALRASAGRSETLKLHLRWCLSPLQARLALRPGAQAEAKAWQQDLELALHSAATSREALQRFALLAESLGQRLLAPVAAERRQILRQALSALQNEPAAVDGLKGLARDLGLSRSRASRLLKDGGGYREARAQARLEKAKGLLQGSSLSIGAIAAECGLGAQAYFSRFFRGQVGLSPREFRKRSQKNRD